MEELEHIERERYGLFCLIGVFAFVALFLLSENILLATLGSISLGLLASGAYVARRMTHEHVWGFVIAESRVNGGNPTKRGVWFGNLFPAVFAFVASLWLLSRA